MTTGPDLQLSLGHRWTFATYVLRPFDITDGPLVPILAVAVVAFAFLVNIAGNRSVGLFSLDMAALKIAGIALFGIAALWSSGFQFAAASQTGQTYSATGFIASVALAILAFKGFTTITNSGAEVTDPHSNVGRAIMISIAVCGGLPACGLRRGRQPNHRSDRRSARLFAGGSSRTCTRQDRRLSFTP